MRTLEEIGKAAAVAAQKLSQYSTAQKNKALKTIAEYLNKYSDEILRANEEDISLAEQNGIRSVMVDRLRLDKSRIDGIADGVLQVAELNDPIGELLSEVTRPNGLIIKKVRVPLGVIAIIYEARPNVTADAAALTLKSGNAVILRGGKEAIRSNTAITNIMRRAISDCGLDGDCIQLIEDTSRETATELMQLNKYVDVLIPRGGASLINSVVKNATVPVIETGVGNCHIYIDANCDEDMAVNIVYNAKTQRPSVCNAAESLVVDSSIAQSVLPKIKAALDKKNVEIRGCERTQKIIDCVPATDEDYYTEFLDYIISVKITDSIDEAIAHINSHNTKHSEAIITNDRAAAEKFTSEIDAAAVYVNASTRFTDGFVFGLGAEIGISTQKMHARGPMGLSELTSYKYVINGNGQIRE